MSTSGPPFIKVVFLDDREQSQTLLYHGIVWFLQEAVTTSVISCWLSDLGHDGGLESSDEVDIHHHDQGFLLFRLRHIYFISL